MFHLILRISAITATTVTLCGFGYTILSLWSAVRFLWQQEQLPPVALPSVSILKPLKGIDPEMFQNLRSHCNQEYPDYELIFGVSDANDPAIAAVDSLKLEFPARRIKLVVCLERLGANTKVSTLAQMLPHAGHSLLLVNDSDIQVRPDYLKQVVAPLARPEVALVTCLYRGVPASTFGSWLEAMGILDFASGVLAAQLVENGIRFGLGSTLAFRRHDLAAIGGFEAFADYLADDYQLGKRLSSQGATVALSHHVVETLLPPYTLRGFLAHQLRWARTVRDSRPGGYAGMAVTHYLLCSSLALLASQGATWGWLLLGAALLVRVISTLAIGRGVLNDRRTGSYLPLLPLRDLLAALIWISGFLGHTVTWRGERFSLQQGKLRRT